MHTFLLINTPTDKQIDNSLNQAKSAASQQHVSTIPRHGSAVARFTFRAKRVVEIKQAKISAGFFLCVSYPSLSLLFSEQKNVRFKDMDVQRRKAAKIFACFLSGRKRAENMNRATALN